MVCISCNIYIQWYTTFSAGPLGAILVTTSPISLLISVFDISNPKPTSSILKGEREKSVMFNQGLTLSIVIALTRGKPDRSTLSGGVD